MKLSSCTISRLFSLLFWGTAFAFAIGVLPNQYAHAYLDPGSGSFILQLIIAGVLGALFSIRVFWGRIIGVFKKDSAAAPDDDLAGADSDSE